jgi:hypothetical protein
MWMEDEEVPEVVRALEAMEAKEVLEVMEDPEVALEATLLPNPTHTQTLTETHSMELVR